MALVDNFDSYTDGNLNGQGGWSGSNSLQVQGSVYQSSPKAVKLTNVAYSYCKKLFSAQGDGNQIFYVRKTTSGSGNLMVRFFEGTTLKFFFQISDDDRLYIGGSTEHFWASATPNTWYKIEVQWQTSDNTARARANDGSWSNWITAFSAFTSIDGLDIGGNPPSGQTFYWDSFSDPNAPPPAVGRSQGIII